MNTPAENIIEEPDGKTVEFGANNNEATGTVEEVEELNSKVSSEFALKLVNALKSLNNNKCIRN